MVGKAFNRDRSASDDVGRAARDVLLRPAVAEIDKMKVILMTSASIHGSSKMQHFVACWPLHTKD